ncbi:CAP-associated domain-containing protein [Staphylococcus americanisciuri]|uniref:CAP-associated domain-containing protein n=1 Tax=Staphylococcus americanisciuri TaxID=2973940 RepID=A0ABT2F2Q9_9STAP|nr:CAP-associated domain-containing protein [Staphylococcus americanisciuri]MCS4486743.1 CAP-associated domain-containing protein [Staphylococcus americanisciuri]
MKRLLIKIFGVFLFIGFLVYLFYAPRLEFDVLENPNKQVEQRYQKANLPVRTSDIDNPKLKEGIGTLVGQSMGQVTKKYGQADRTYHYFKDYRTFVYHRQKAYILVMAKGDTVKSVYMTGQPSKDESGPIEIGQDAAKLYDNLSLITECEFDLDGKHYHYELSDTDVKTQALMQFDNRFAQVFIDQQSNKITGVRYLDKEALVAINPYSSNEESEENMVQSEEQNPDQNSNQLLTLYELTNEMRKLHQREPLKINSALENVATVQLFQATNKSSAEFTENNLVSLVNETPFTYQTLSQNVGYNFSDIPTLVNSWMNSDTHRSRLLSGQYDEMGGKISDNYFLLIFAERGDDQDDV